MPACFVMRNRKGMDLMQGGRGGEELREVGEGNHNLDILYKKKIIINKRGKERIDQIFKTWESNYK